jgi:gamma-glutamylcyclotransferase (GGCT)/AIG2-like uncharacterized protein YtfP
MLRERLCNKSRCPGATRLITAALPNFTLQFAKRSIDKSGKATIVPSNGSVVHGVIYRIPEAQLPQLDAAEGAGNGYDRLNSMVVIETNTGAAHDTKTYIANSLEGALRPYDWYLKLVIAGAVQNGLPSEYIEGIRCTESLPDPDPNRKSRLEALRILEAIKAD